jgi:hypothetical protein
MPQPRLRSTIAVAIANAAVAWSLGNPGSGVWAEKRPSAERRGDRGPAPGGVAAVGEQEDDRKGDGEQCLRGIDVEEQRVLDRIVSEEVVVQRVQYGPVHAAKLSQIFYSGLKTPAGPKPQIDREAGHPFQRCQTMRRPSSRLELSQIAPTAAIRAR